MAKEFETIGAHIRNILTPYANIIEILKDLQNPNMDDKHKEILKKYLLSGMDIHNLEINLQHFIDLSYLDEIEDINWRDTSLYKKIVGDDL